MASSSSDAVVGPFPEGVTSDEQRDEYDRLRRRALWTMPSGLYVVGSRDGDRLNLMTLNWATQAADSPAKLLAVGVEKSALTHELITLGGVFSVNTVDREDRAIVRKFTKPVEVDAAASTANGFAFHAEVTGAPILDQAPAWFDCRVQQAVDLDSHTLFLGAIVACGFQRPEDTPVLRMEDTRMNYGG